MNKPGPNRHLPKPSMAQQDSKGSNSKGNVKGGFGIDRRGKMGSPEKAMRYPKNC